MTIAAGFRCYDGVLLCADTEEQGWVMTLQASKLSSSVHRWGKVAFAFAGNTGFALSAIQKCESRLDHLDGNQVMSELESILDGEYRRNVLSHPDHAVDGSLAYRLLIAVWRLGSKARLFVTTQTAMREVSDYECVGAGDYLAHYLVRPSFTTNMQERPLFSLAAYALANVKGYVPGCGGRSQFLLMRDDGTIGITEAFSDYEPYSGIEWLERQSRRYDSFARQLLFAVVNPEGQTEFEAVLEGFNKQVNDMRRNWLEGKAVHESFARFKVVGGLGPEER